mmetsp:Transcript_7721/g.14254  ORF Transcript_7721/g.14254 Transcript_7721/m.14254 type:complete len:141 (-) Transcript_7721:2995-3417(-)
MKPWIAWMKSKVNEDRTRNDDVFIHVRSQSLSIQNISDERIRQPCHNTSKISKHIMRHATWGGRLLLDGRMYEIYVRGRGENGSVSVIFVSVSSFNSWIFKFEVLAVVKMGDPVHTISLLLSPQPFLHDRPTKQPFRSNE